MDECQSLHLAKWMLALEQVTVKISKVYQFCTFSEKHLHKCHILALNQVIGLTVHYYNIMKIYSGENSPTVATDISIW